MTCYEIHTLKEKHSHFTIFYHRSKATLANWSVSGHGYEDRNVTFEVPEGVTIHFYVESGRNLDVQEAIDMWNTIVATKKGTIEIKSEVVFKFHLLKTGRDQIIY